METGVETKMGEANEHELPREVVESLLADVLAESRSTIAGANQPWLRLIEE